MSAYLSVTVHNSYLPTTSTASNIKDMLDSKYFIYLYVDDEGVKLRANRQPHVIQVAPGAHTIKITRKPIGKTGIVDVVNMATGAVMGAALGGAAGAVLGGDLAGKVIGEDPLKNARVIEFHEGETIACDVKSDWLGKPKIQWL